jgi:hypothetical protein
LNSPLPILSPIHWFLEQFQQVSFLHLYTCVFIVCTIFILLPLSLPPPPPMGANPPFHPPVLRFCRRKNIKDKTRNMTFC